MDIELFVESVKFYCVRRNVKPTVACRESGAGASFLDNVRRGRVPSVEKVQLLAQYLGVTTSELLGETASVAGIPLSAESIKLLAAYARADAHTREIVDLALAPYRKGKRPARERADRNR